MSTTATARGRTRAIEGASGKAETGKASAEMKKEAKTYYLENKASNASKSKADKARKKLLGLLDDAKLEAFQFKAQDGENTISLDVNITTGDTTVIDVTKLEKLVTKDQFYRIVTATKTAIEEVAGKDVYNQVSTTTTGTGTRNVQVKPVS